MLLLADRHKIRGWPHGAVVLDAAADFLGEVVADLHVRRKNKPVVHAGSMKRFVKSWIERQIPRSDLLIDDRPYLPSPGVRRKFCPLVPNLVRQAQPHRPF